MKSVGLLALVLLALGCSEDKPGNSSQIAPNNTANNADNNDVVNGALTITSPQAGEVFLQTSVEVAGTARDVNEVQINGVAVPVSGGSFSTTIDLAEGERSIDVTAPNTPTASVTVFVDLSPPELEILSPEPGRFVEGAEGDQLLIRGRAFDAGAGIDRVEIGGFPIGVNADGSFETTVPLNVGANVMDVVAFDKAERNTSALRGAIYGDFVPWGQPMSDSIFGEVTPRAFNVIEDALLLQLENGVVDQLLEQFLPDDDRFSVNGVTYESVDIEIIPRDGYIEISGVIETLEIDVQLRQDLLVTELNANAIAIANPVELYAELVVGIDENGGLSLEQRNANVSLGEFELRSDAGLLDAVLGLLEGFARDLAQDALNNLIADFVIPEIFSPDLLTQSVNFLGQELIFEILLEELVVSEMGLRLVGNVEMPLGPDLNAPDSPGVLTTPGRPPQDTPTRMLRLSLADDFANKILFTAWRAGVANLNVNDLIGDGGSLPIELNVGALSLLLGSELKDYAPSETPVEIELRPLLPPVASIQDNNQFPLKVTIPDLMLDLYLAPENGARERWATVNVALDLDVNVRLEDGDVSLDFQIGVLADLFDEPLFDLDDAKVEGAIVSLLGGLPRILGPDGLDGIFDLSSIDILGIKIGNGEVRQGGTSGDYLAAEVDLSTGGEEEPPEDGE